MTKRDLRAIGQRLRILREMAGLTQVELARRVYVTQPAVSHWETGSKLPSRQMQHTVADVLRTSRSMLFREAVEREQAA